MKKTDRSFADGLAFAALHPEKVAQELQRLYDRQEAEDAAKEFRREDQKRRKPRLARAVNRVKAEGVQETPPPKPVSELFPSRWNFEWHGLEPVDELREARAAVLQQKTQVTLNFLAQSKKHLRGMMELGYGAPVSKCLALLREADKLYIQILGLMPAEVCTECQMGGCDGCDGRGWFCKGGE